MSFIGFRTYHRDIEIIHVSPTFGLGLHDVDLSIGERSLVPNFRQDRSCLGTQSAPFALEQGYPAGQVEKPVCGAHGRGLDGKYRLVYGVEEQLSSKPLNTTWNAKLRFK